MQEPPIGINGMFTDILADRKIACRRLEQDGAK
jgi:hypothetical protein